MNYKYICFYFIFFICGIIVYYELYEYDNKIECFIFVFVYGFLFFLFSYCCFIFLLVKEGIVIVFDLLLFGKSDKFYLFKYFYYNLVMIIIDLIEYLFFLNIVLVGYFMGG